MRKTDYAILGLLSEMPMTGYALKKAIDDRFHFFWNESYGQIFPTLKALGAAGLIEEIESSAETKRARRAYAITPAGLDALRQWLGQPVERESVRLEILLKMYFSHLVDAAVMLEHLVKFQQNHEQDLALLNLFQTELTQLADAGANHPEILQVISCGQKVNAAYLEWSREAIKFLEQRR